MTESSSASRPVPRDRRWLGSSRVRHLMVLLLDGVFGVLSLWLAMLLRFEGEIPLLWLERMPPWIALLLISRMAASYVLRIHRWSFRFSGLADGARVAVSAMLGTGLFLFMVYLLRPHGPPRSVLVMELLLSIALMASVRFSPRLVWMYQVDLARSRKGDVERVLIFGAGATGEMLLRDLQRSDEHSYQVVGFVDDDNAKWGSIVGGRPVFGGVADLHDLAQRHRIDMVLLAVPRMPAARIREILSLCGDLKIRFKILPVSYLYLQERISSSMLKDLSPEDLLSREPVTLSGHDEVPLSGRAALVTGAAGSIGSEICRQLLDAGIGRLAMVDINENGLYMQLRRFRKSYPSVEMTADVADIRDAGRLRALFAERRPHDVFHAAAHKHVPLMESAPGEAVKNNIVGTRNVARAADAYGAERFVFISTDKAVRPTSVMGASKRVGEMLIRALARRSETRFCAVRFGNVLDSAGSVVPLFREQIAAGGPVTVTHPEVRRYFMTIAEAVGLVLKAGYGDFGELCVLEMGEQIRILDLARHMITMTGQAPDADIAIEIIGLRPGEKLYEELLTEEEENTRQIDRKILLATPAAPAPDFEEQLEWLIRAAEAEDADGVRRGLRLLVPTFRSPQDEVAGQEASVG